MKRRSLGGEVSKVSGGPRRFAALLLGLVTACTGVSLVTPSSPAAALSGFEFSPGYIITDDLFYDATAMSASEIQSFLDAKIGSCQNGRCLNVATLPVTTRAASYSSDTGALVCSAIPGGNLRVSELIYRTQAACGISAKVILVTLQKEQGLVTSRAPGDWALKAAMGMGCPDTAPCNEAFAGLANQIMSGARQLKVYKVGRFARQPGVHFIQYSPNAACGGSNVDIRNYATAALYNYTPYQPNNAALANLGGTGDGCSSYGNRNFWAYYTNWFGSTTGGGRVAIDEAYEDADGSATLGAGVAYLDCPITATRCWPKYEKGSIYWSPRTGADIVLGAKDTAYRALGGPDSPIGYPITGEYEYQENGGGSAQLFEDGTLFDSAAGMFPTYGAVRTAYFAKQGAWGELGWPTSGVSCKLVNCAQIYQHGAVAVIGADVTYIGQVERDVWVEAGGTNGILGTPTSTILRYIENGGGSARIYTGGTVFSSSTGTFAVTEPVRTGFFAQQGAWGALGWPASAQQCVASGCWQRFEHGAIVTNGTASYTLTSAEFDSYLIAGGPSGMLGLPTSAPYTYTQNGGGTTRLFANGSLFSSSAGSFAVTDPIRTAYFAQEGAWGALGWPTSIMTCSNGTCVQQFQGGTLSSAGTAPPGGGTSGETMDVYLSRIAQVVRSNNLGAPTSDTLIYTENGGGVAQVFGASTVFSSASGAYVVTGALRSAYFAKQGAWGELGWPSGAQQCAAVGCWQQFQQGIVFSSGVSLSTAEYDAYLALGGPTGALGLPQSGVYDYSQNGGGTARVFTQGSLFTSSAGAFAVTEPIRASYFVKQGAWGELGWPTSAAVKRGNTVVQMFQNGAIAISSGITSYLGAPERDVWVAAGGPDGVLGVPQSSLYDYPQNGGGTARVYTGGSVFASASGLYAVTDPVRTTYFASQGAWGSYGWPTSAMSCADGNCTQQFQNGSIVVPSG